jgi:hypothetical protein
MQPPKSETCVICGIRPAETVDHVPPKCFFKGVTNAQLRTVPSCWACNNGASSDDEDMRFYISAQIGKQNPASKVLWDDGAHKTIKRKIKLRSSFLANVRDVEVLEQDGSIKNRLAFLVPISTYQRVLERITRGLYFFHTGRILPVNVAVFATMLADTPDMETEDIRRLKIESVGAGACIYRYEIVPDDADRSLWIYGFHEAHWAMVTTGAVK